MEISILPRSPKKNQETPQQLWIKEEGLYKVYKNTEHTLLFRGPPNLLFTYIMSQQLGNLTIDYKPVANPIDKPAKSEYINKKFSEGETLTGEGYFNNQGCFYMKICGYCKERPAKLRILLSCLSTCDMVIQFASDALIKQLRKRKSNQLESDSMMLDPEESTSRRKRPKTAEFGSFPVTKTKRSAVDFLRAAMNDPVNMTISSHKGGDVLVAPKVEVPCNSILYMDYQQDIKYKLERINRLRNKINNILFETSSMAFIILPQFNEILQKLDDIQKTVAIFEQEQLEPTLYFLLERQSRLSRIANELSDLQEDVSSEDKRISTQRAEFETPIFRHDLQLQQEIPFVYQLSDR